jgi:hypothetical protein
MAVEIIFSFGHSGGTGAIFGGYLAKVALYHHILIFFWLLWHISASI